MDTTICKRFVACLISLFCLNAGFAQTVTSYMVQREGETIESLARRFGTTAYEIQRLNPGFEGYIPKGTVIHVPFNSTLEKEYENSSRSSVKYGNDRSFFATKIQAGLNIDMFTGKGGEGFDPGIGYNLGISEDFFNNSPLGIECGVYYSKYRISFGTGKDRNFKASMHYVEFQLMLDLRLLYDESALELNFGIGADLGLYAPVSYKSTDLDYDLFSGTNNKETQIKDISTGLLYGLTYRWSDGYLRALIHDGFTNISKISNSAEVYLWKCELSLGFIF